MCRLEAARRGACGERLPCPVAAEQIGEREVGPRIAPLVVEAGVARGDDRSAARRRSGGCAAACASDSAPRFGRISVVRRRRRRSMSSTWTGRYGMRARTSACMNPVYGASTRVSAIVAAEEVGVALRPDEADGRDRRPIDQVVLVRLVPAHDRLGASGTCGGPRGRRRRGATRAGCRRRCPRSSTCAPRLPACSRRGSSPGPTGTSPSTPAQLVPAEHAVHALAGVAVLLEARVVVAPLVIEHQDRRRARRSPSDRGSERACAVTEPLFMPDQRQSGPPAARVDAVVQLPELDAAGVAPHDPLAVGRVVPVGLRAAAPCPLRRGRCARSCRSSRCCRARGRSSCCR